MFSLVLYTHKYLFNHFISTAVWGSLPEKLLMKPNFVLLMAIIKVKFLKCKMVALEFLEKNCNLKRRLLLQKKWNSKPERTKLFALVYSFTVL